ncbi:kynurenine 3-monooxygenase, mitochondrial precursor, partial [Spiromyces aspiralis]
MCLSENKAKTRGRSINLAISERGLAALRNLDPDLEQQVLDRIIPMYGRMIHSPSGMQESQAYSVFGQHINSVSRTELNCFLLDKARELPNVSLRFNHSFISADFDARLVRLID